MNTGENKCIRYLMKEMDPSEEIEFEQMMREEEDLLIEVESLRATYKKVAKIPLKNPPKSLTKKIIYDAKKIQSGKVNKPSKFYTHFKKSIAAAFLFSLLGGGYYFISGSMEPGEANTSTSEVSPWVDRNEVLKYTNDSQSTRSSSLELELHRSYEKLQLVGFPVSSQTSGFHLTGSSE